MALNSDVVGFIGIICFIVILSLAIICFNWIRKTTGRKRNSVIIQHVLIFPLIFERIIEIIYSYFNDDTMYSEPADLIMHFIFWSGFWILIQIKLYDIIGIRLKMERLILLNNTDWSSSFGVFQNGLKSLTFEDKSIWLRYTNNLPIIIQLIILLIFTISIQVIVRISTESIFYENIVVIIIFILQFSLSVVITYPIKSINDRRFRYQQLMKFLVVNVIFVLIWLGVMIASDIIGGDIGIALNQSWYFVFSSWVLYSCYYDTKWIHDKRFMLAQEKLALTLKMAGLQNGTKEKEIQAVQEILSIENGTGFEHWLQCMIGRLQGFMLLLHVECTQFLELWSSDPISDTRCELLVARYLKEKADEYDLFTMIGKDIEALIYEFAKFREGDFEPNESSDDVTKYMKVSNQMDEYIYIRNIYFDDPFDHYDYIFKRYSHISSLGEIYTPDFANCELEKLVGDINKARLKAWKSVTSKWLIKEVMETAENESINAILKSTLEKDI